MRDWRLALRHVAAHPGFSALIVVVCALVIGTTATVFGAVDSILFRPPRGVYDSSKLFRLYQQQRIRATESVASRVFSYAEFVDLRFRVADIARLGAFAHGETSLGTGIAARPVTAGFVTAGFFELLGVPIAMGREFAPTDASAAASSIAIISRRYWRGVFGGRADVLGQVLTIGGKRFVITGVLANDFSGLDALPVDIWLPLGIGGTMFHGLTWDLDRGERWLQIVGRYAPGNGAKRLEPLLGQSLGNAVDDARTSAASIKVRVTAAPLLLAWGPGRSLAATVSMLMISMTGVVLLLGSANIAAVYIVRMAHRRRELAVRLALGATFRTLLCQLLLEASCLGVLGAALGLAIALFGVRILSVLISSGPQSATAFAMDVRVLGVGASALITLIVAATLFPLSSLRRADLALCMKAGSAQGVPARALLQRCLVISQVALATTLLVAAGLFIHALRAVLSIDLGLDPKNVTVANVDLKAIGYNQVEIDRFYLTALEQLRRVRQVQSAALATTVPFHSGAYILVSRPGERPMLERDGGMAWANAVTPEFFRTLGMKLVEGRTFSTTEARSVGERVAIVNHSFAVRFWPGEDAIGKCLAVGSENAACTRVVGVVSDAARDRPNDPASMQFFLPFEQAAFRFSDRSLFVRSREDAGLGVAEIRRVLLSIKGDLPYPSITRMQSLLDPYTRPWEVGATLLTIFATISVFLAMLAFQSVIAFSVLERRREFALRVAIGGSTRHVLLLVASEGSRLIAAGAFLGFIVAAVAVALVSPPLYRTSVFQLSAYAVAAIILLLSGVAAGILPAMHASRVQPAEALRNG